MITKLDKDQEDYLIELDKEGTIRWDPDHHCKEPLPSFLLLPLEPFIDDISPAGRMIARMIREIREKETKDKKGKGK